MPAELLKTVLSAARAGAEILEKRLGQKRHIDQKGRFDFVTEADVQSEKAILGIIQKAYPDHGILAEESSARKAWQKARQGIHWVIDPLDGTTNYIHKYPAFAVSVAVLQDGAPLAGVVIDVARGQEYWASRGGGAFCGERKISVSQVTDPAEALFLTGFPVRQKHRLDEYLGAFRELFIMSSGVRRAGAAALDLAWVASGRGDGFFEMGLSPWDLAAGRLLIEEAGGKVSDFSGNQDNFLWTGEHVASNGLLHEVIRESCARHLSPA